MAVTNEELLYHRTLLPFRPAPVPTCSTGCHSSSQQNEYSRLNNANSSQVNAHLDSLLAQDEQRTTYFRQGPSTYSTDLRQQQYQPDTNPPTGTYDSSQRRFSALRFLGSNLTHDTVVEKLDQKFKDYATVWERDYSPLCVNCACAANFLPVVDGEWKVIAYYGLVRADELIKPNKVLESDLSFALRQYPIFVDKSRQPPDGWTTFGLYLNSIYAVIISIDGEVLGGELVDKGGNKVDEYGLLDMLMTVLNIVDLVMDVMLIDALVDLALKGGTYLLKALGRRALRRTLYRGATKELAEKYAKGEIDGAAQALKLSRCYDARMGIPPEHLSKMIEAARDTDSIAIFRANKPAAIPLIREGAVPKPKYFTFKSSPRTGVLMATEPDHIATAYRNGYFVVDADGVARNTVGGVTKELPLKSPSWTLEKGQVIAPNGKPVVGDYDLLGVMPRQSPGSNVVGVPKDPAKGDWMGPYVDRYSKALNPKLDQARVLHGAQDQFSHAQFGGLTDDTAYAVYPDGSVYVMEGRAAQEEFYKAYGRQTIMGQYPRPAPGTAVKDEVGAMRARK
jgi:hypothetical protein